MRGLALNPNLMNVGAIFIREAQTSPYYSLWSIGDEYPGMLRSSDKGVSINLEIWQIDADSLIGILSNEPPGLCLGKIELSDGEVVLGILAEPYICERQREITAWRGWRAYTKQI